MFELNYKLNDKLTSLLETLRKVVSLKLHFMSERTKNNKLLDSDIRSFIDHNYRKLTTLTLMNQSETHVTTDTWMYIFQKCKHLTNVHIGGNRTKVDLMKLFDIHTTPPLHTLNIEICFEIDAEVIIHILTSIPTLKKFDFARGRDFYGGRYYWWQDEKRVEEMFPGVEIKNEEMRGYYNNEAELRGLNEWWCDIGC